MGSPSASPALSPHAADAAGDADGAMERDVERDAVGVDKRSHVSASYVALEHMASRLAVVTSIICMRRPCRPYKTAERASSNLRLISWWPSRRAMGPTMWPCSLSSWWTVFFVGILSATVSVRSRVVAETKARQR